MDQLWISISKSVTLTNSVILKRNETGKAQASQNLIKTAVFLWWIIKIEKWSDWGRDSKNEMNLQHKAYTEMSRRITFKMRPTAFYDGNQIWLEIDI